MVRRFVSARAALALVCVVLACVVLGGCKSHPIPRGVWDVGLETNSEAVPRVRVAMELGERSDGSWWATFRNGEERVRAPVVFETARRVVIDFPHYESRIEGEFVREKKAWRLEGVWRKARGEGVAVVPMSAVPGPGGAWTRRPAIRNDVSLNRRVAGRWAVTFEASGAAVGVFEVDDKGHAWGTVLTPTGDYRYLDGWVEAAAPPEPRKAGELPESLRDPREVAREKRLRPIATMYLSSFDGGHMFAFEMNLIEGDEAWGVFTSGNWWVEGFTARRDGSASLPNAFGMTKATGSALTEAVFRDLSGEAVRVEEAIRRAHGVGPGEAVPGPTLVEVFGSWCPNCHDAAAYLAELRERYPRLGVVGLAFERTEDHAASARQVRRYFERHGLDADAWPVLIAGMSKKAAASAALPALDGVRSYPTTLFVDAEGRVRHVYTGFSGPATGDAYDELRASWEARIEAMLGELGR